MVLCLRGKLGLLSRALRAWLGDYAAQNGHKGLLVLVVPGIGGLEGTKFENGEDGRRYKREEKKFSTFTFLTLPFT